MQKIDIPQLISKYFYLDPDPADPLQRVSFGTSGHRGSSLTKSFNEAHIFAITQAICDYRKAQKIKGKLFIGIDTHALSTPALMSALRVFAANGVEVVASDTYTPTPVISHTILEANEKGGFHDGIVVTPSHNPPQDGGFKYNPPHGGPAGSETTKTIEKKANDYLQKRTFATIPYESAQAKTTTRDLITPYVEALTQIVDIDAIRSAKLRIAADPLGGSAIDIYKKINEIHRLGFDLKDSEVDFTFSFMPPDHDGQIRMDCSSPYAMANLLALKDSYDLAFANDTDADRHGIVTPAGGLLNPNHYLCVAIWHLFHTRKWPKGVKIAKTVVTSSMIDRIAQALEIEVYETPVGFKWFSQGLHDGWLAFAGEESAGASFLRFDASPWSTDKDGIIMNLLAAEITATRKDPALIYEELERMFGKSYYARIDAPATPEQKALIKKLTPADLPIDQLAGEPIERIYTKAPGNNEPIGGMKIVTKNGWAAFRPSGTEAIYKIYAESFLSQDHLERIQREIQDLLQTIFKKEWM